MKIVIGYPPIEGGAGIPQISQNRQFQWTSSGIVSYAIYPVVPAYAASLLKEKGYRVFWLDGIAERLTYKQWERKLFELNPDILAIETKTPVIRYHWDIIKKIKNKKSKIKIVMMGDHVTALSKESMEKCPVDFVITGGDYDFGLLSIADFRSKGGELEAGIWYRKKLKTKNQKASSKNYSNSGTFRLNRSLDELPVIDRGLTKWQLYSRKNSNFYRVPGAYTMFGRDCWWGRCSFCSYTTLFPGEKFRVMSVKRAMAEVENLVENCQVKEIMDDSGTFPVGDWLREFCREIIRRGYQKRIRINCNMRFNSGLVQKDYDLMGRAGFRFILFGLESANQSTLDRLNKNLKVEQVEPSLVMAKKAGLKPHITVMVGYPWEGEAEILNTVNFTKSLFQKGLVDSMQATIVIPYPGTPLFQNCLRKNCLKTLDWNRYDMREPIMKTKIPEEKLLSTVRDLYSSSIWNKTFIFNTFNHLKSLDGWKYVSFQGLKYLGKLLEFKSSSSF